MSEERVLTIDDREITITHPDKILWPEEGITKGDLVGYYQAIAPVMLPHLKDRPVTFRMYHEGITGQGIYRREAPKSAPEWLRQAPYTTITDPHTIELPLIDDTAGLLWYVNSGAIELHTWSSHLPELDEPDRVVLDIDPGDEADFAMVLDAAVVVKAALDELGLEGYPKTSGGRGMHVFWPLTPGYEFVTVREWVEQFAINLAGKHPGLIAPAHGGTHTGKLITIDYAQNSIGRNTAAVYTARARAGTPVSTPVSWREVQAGKFRPSDFTIRTVSKRIEKKKDLYEPMLEKGSTLPANAG